MISQLTTNSSKATRTDSQNPIMGISSKGMKKRNAKKTRRDSKNMNGFVFKKMLSSPKKKKQSIERKQYQSEEFVVDDGTDKYAQLSDFDDDDKNSRKRNSNTWKNFDFSSEYTMDLTDKCDELCDKADSEHARRESLPNKIKSWIRAVSAAHFCLPIIPNVRPVRVR